MLFRYISWRIFHITNAHVIIDNVYREAIISAIFLEIAMLVLLVSFIIIQNGITTITLDERKKEISVNDDISAKRTAKTRTVEGDADDISECFGDV